ncbi:hypothetical protein C8R45DRAFT_995800 [Mycena sanguinolenta]|nr:hypothetical protein C8R45DRAFT_995800 [Mycena sanguinolenta]
MQAVPIQPLRPPSAEAVMNFQQPKGTRFHIEVRHSRIGQSLFVFVLFRSQSNGCSLKSPLQHLRPSMTLLLPLSVRPPNWLLLLLLTHLRSLLLSLGFPLSISSPRRFILPHCGAYRSRSPPAPVMKLLSSLNLLPPPLRPLPPSLTQLPPPAKEWNTSKTAVLAQARAWNRQVQTSGRHRSLPISPPRPIPVPAPADEPWKRHSVPPGLAPSTAFQPGGPSLTFFK